jgi:putative CocE/NonD family hydrolase
MDKSLFDSIEEIENVWITMSDGCRLAARVWLPEGARGEPVPAVLEYIPYRKRDFMRARDEPIHRYFALKGFASVRIDLRGSGDSDGVLHDEYSQQEHEDALEAIAWIAGQDWCSGAIGMMGISWGGFNALQVAALRPPALKAIITLCSTDDRYADDAHYMGGCLLNENMQWGSGLTLYSALPPDPALVGERWRAMWQERLEALEPFPALWMRHPWRDEYWKHGSICENYDAIEIPVYAIGGWADGYSNAIPRLMENLSCPRKGLIGPWAHNFPHDALPGPSIGFLQEAVRWWEQWLRGRPTGIMDEPMLRVWMQESVAPQAQYEIWPGRWIAEETWPSPRITRLRYFLNPGHLWFDSDPPTELSFSSPQTTGVQAGEWCAFGVEGEMPRDQRSDDGGSLVFDSDPLPAPCEILGAPVVELDLQADQPVAMLAARLCDIAPDGSSLRVSYGLLNLCHRDGHEFPTPLEPGAWYRVRLQLNDIAHRFSAGHRIRVALSTSYWPIAWPTPAPVALTVRTGSSILDLPLRASLEGDERLPAFAAPEAAPTDAPRRLRRRSNSRRIEIDLASSEQVYTLKSGGGEPDGAAISRIEAIDLDIGYRSMRRYRILESDPLSAQTELGSMALLRRGDWQVRIECRTRLTTTADAFQFGCDLECYEGDRLAFEKSWSIALPRRLL